MRDYVAGHLGDWPDDLKSPPHAWWSQAQAGEEPPFWAIVTGPFPFDEIVTAFQCQCLSMTSRVEHMEAALLVFRRDCIELHDVEGKVPSLRLLCEELRTSQLDSFSWYGVANDDNGMRLTFADGESLELGFERDSPQDDIVPAWERITKQQVHAMPPLGSEPPAPLDDIEISPKWNIWFDVPQQELSALLKFQPSEFLITWKATEQALPLHYLWHLTDHAWEHLTPASQHCLRWICCVFENRWGYQDEDAEFF